MKRLRNQNHFRRGLLILLVFSLASWQVLAVHGDSTAISAPLWANPTNTALKQVGVASPISEHPSIAPNITCSFVDYKLFNGDPHSGCVLPAAYGQMDIDTSNILFMNAGKAIPLIPMSPNDVIVPWPRTLDALLLSPSQTEGSALSIYNNILTAVQDKYDMLNVLVGKQVVEAPTGPITDGKGTQLTINPGSIAFSSNSSWLVVETMAGSFVRINLATLDVVPFAPAMLSQGNASSGQSRVSISSNGRYVAIENKIAQMFRVYDLSSCSLDTTTALLRRTCISHDYWPFVSSHVAGFTGVTSVNFVNDSLLSFNAGGNVYDLAPAASIDSLIDYLALGDSYTAGEGAFSYMTGTDTPVNECHLSSLSYPMLLTRDLFSKTSGHSVACSGAVIDDIGSTGDMYAGQVQSGHTYQDLEASQPAFLQTITSNFLPGYIAQQRFVSDNQPRIITVSVGGDDLGFGDIIERCVGPKVTRYISGNTCYDTYEDRREVKSLIDKAVPRLTALYKQLIKESPESTIYAVDYPQIASDTGNCGFNVHLNKEELEFSQELIAYLDGAIGEAAAKANVHYVDVSQALTGHRLCEATGSAVAMNGLTAGRDAGIGSFKFLGNESYHPNALGQELIEQSILRQTHNFKINTASSASTNSGQALLNAPKSGRPIVNVIPDKNLTKPVANTKTPMHVSSNGIKNGLKPNRSYTIRLDGTKGVTLATTSSDASGSMNATVSLPGDTIPGVHTIDITGSNQAGEPVDVTQPVLVTTGTADSDGDGIPDVDDSCPAAINSGQDADGDGIDDTCDSNVSVPTISSNPLPTSNSTTTQGTTSMNPAPVPPAQAVIVSSQTPVLSVVPSSNGPTGIAVHTPSDSSSLNTYGGVSALHTATLETGSMPFPDDSITTITTFETPNNSKELQGNSEDNYEMNGHALGAQTVLPTSSGGVRLAPRPIIASLATPFGALRIINWLFWIELLGLLLLILFLLDMLFKQREKLDKKSTP